MNDLTNLLQNRIPGKSLPREFYLDEDIFAEEMERVFYSNWLFAGVSCEVPDPGDYFVLPVGAESLIVIRDKGGELHAHFNVCRHRGSKIVTEERGCAKALVCPYHQWVYAPDGNLTNARLMGDSFRPEEYALRRAHIREVAGLVFVCVSEKAPDFQPMARDIEPQLKPHGLDRAKIIVRHHYEVRANWKVLVENNRECYHCRVSHPEFCMSNYDLGLPGDARGDAEYYSLLDREYGRWEALGLSPKEVNFPNGEPHRVSRLPLKDGFLTESLDGKLVAPLMGSFEAPEGGSLRLITLPNFWCHANCDYAMTTRLLPVSPDLTRVEVSFFVDEDAEEGTDYDPETVAHVWKATSEQDWELCENNHAGIKSVAYEPGPFSTLTESSVESFVVWYLARLEGRATHSSVPKSA
jgi:glycine betaine catabolism A